MISQAEKRGRGTSFQDEVRRSWALIPGTWRLRITDTGAGSRPADELVLTAERNYLIEMKRTQNSTFSLGLLRPTQIKGLHDFDVALQQNYGLVFWSIQNSTLDTAYAFRFYDFAQHYCRSLQKSISQADLVRNLKHAVLPRIEVEGEPGYDLRGVLQL